MGGMRFAIMIGGESCSGEEWVILRTSVTSMRMPPQQVFVGRIRAILVVLGILVRMSAHGVY
jgi:hypothetical protein